MENYEYDKVFVPDGQDNDELSPVEMEEMANLLHGYENGLTSVPRFILPFAPAIFEKTVAACERIAKEFSGRIRAKIDYSFFTATVELWCCCVEFERGEFMGILHEITSYAISVSFTPLLSGDLHIKMQLPYFASAQTKKQKGD